MKPSIRFEVFKRDGFQCGYCGRKVPGIILEVDHVLAVANGGTDDFDNLVTSCFECNRGKSHRLLNRVPPGVDVAAKTAEIAERELQLAEYTRWKVLLKDREDFQVKEVRESFGEIPGASFNRKGEGRWFFQDASARTFLRRLGLVGVEDALEATRAAAWRWEQASPEDRAFHIWRYFCGCCWHLIKRPASGGD